eukprot:gene22180-biopygen23701
MIIVLVWPGRSPQKSWDVPPRRGAGVAATGCQDGGGELLRGCTSGSASRPSTGISAGASIAMWRSRGLMVPLIRIFGAKYGVTVLWNGKCTVEQHV